MLRVLLVEDEPDLRDLWSEILSGKGYDIQAVGSVSEAVNWIVREEQPDLAIVDWSLPDGDGGQVVRALRDRGMVGGVLISSGMGPQLPSGHGADRVLSKPFRVRDLLQTLTELAP